MSSIVHEAFHGGNSSTVSRGVRCYNSAIIIGTKDPCLGMQMTGENKPTFSRLSHINFDVERDGAQSANTGSKECQSHSR